MSRSKLFFGAAAVALIAGAAQAATVTITPKVVGYFDNAFNPGPIPADNSAPGVYQINFLVGIEGAPNTSGDTGFGLVGWDVAMSNPSLSPTAGAPYAGNIKTVDTNGAAPGGLAAAIATNGDFGPSTSDLKALLASVAGGAFGSADPRNHIGMTTGTALQQSSLANANAAFDAETGAAIVQNTHPPFVLGTAYVSFDGLTNAVLGLTNVQVGFKNATSGAVTVRTNEQVILGTVDFIVPEPATLSLAALGAVGLIRRRRA